MSLCTFVINLYAKIIYETHPHIIIAIACTAASIIFILVDINN